ncbi:MAG: aminoglycoside phosphotransferase family protein, partial [Synechococcus sp.]|nr:aminoglycoside phosphotransferase family protein [Synechococcus sp.]
GAMAAAGGRWELPRVVPVRGSGAPCLEQGGQVWRLLTFIERSRSVDTITGHSQALQVGRALGTFHSLIHDLPTAELADTLEGFHVTPGYLAAFERVLRRTEVPLTPQAQHCIAFIRDRETFMPVLEEAQRSGQLRQRPIHGDPKVNNILFDTGSGDAIALVDLDTVKPGLIHYDIGDCLRSGCNRLGEESRDWRSVHFDLELCEAILEGYITVAHRFLSEADYHHIAAAIRLLSLELGLRFFSDHLAGDVYFRTSRPRHNLERALVQFRLTESIELQFDAIGALVERLRRTVCA